MSVKDLETFFFDNQMDYLQDCFSDAELIDEVERLVTDEKFKELLSQ
jgi:hypothetical protein